MPAYAPLARQCEPLRAHRLVERARDRHRHDPERDDERVFVVSGEQFVALDARTGDPLREFGTGGKGRPDRRRAASRGVSLYGSAAYLPRHGHRRHLHDRPVRPAAPGPWGYIRSYDAVAGQLNWRFNTILRPGEFGARDVGGRVLGTHRSQQRLDGGQRRRGAGLRLPADRHPAPQLVRRTPATRQPVPGNAALPGVRYGTPRVALPVDPPRPPGLRHYVNADPGRHHGRRAAGQGGRAGDQAGVRLRLRPHDRRDGPAHRRAARAAVRTCPASACRRPKSFPTLSAPFDRQGSRSTT